MDPLPTTGSRGAGRGDPGRAVYRGLTVKERRDEILAEDDGDVGNLVLGF